MAWTTKTILAGLLGTGLVVSTITWTGGTNIDSIRSTVGKIQAELEQSISDNEFLKNSYNTLKSTFDGAVQQANSTINNMKREREILNGQIEDLTNELNNLKEQGANGQVEAQAEIDRLVGELEKANAQILALDNELKAIEQGTTYTAISKANYTAPTTATIDDGTGLFVTQEALAFNSKAVEVMKKQVHIDNIESDYFAQNMEFEIIGIDTYTNAQNQTFLSYVIKPKLSQVWDIYSDGVNAMLMEAHKGTVPYVYFETIDGDMVGRGQLQ